MRRAFFFIVALCLATPSFASIPRASALDVSSSRFDPLPQTRIRVSEDLAPFERPAPSLLSRALRQGYEQASTTSASGLAGFLSVDPGKDWDMDQPQSWNLYAYARNNPVLNSDPDGKAAQAVVGGLIGAVVGIYAAGVTETMKVMDGNPTTLLRSAQAVAAGAVGGAVSGVIGSTCPTCGIAARGARPVGSLISGVIGSMAGGVVTRAIAGKPQTISAARADAVGGAAGVVAGQVLVKAGTAIVGPTVGSLSMRGAALRADAAANNAGLGADRAVQQTIKNINSAVNAAAAAGGESVNTVVAATLPDEKKNQ